MKNLRKSAALILAVLFFIICLFAIYSCGDGGGAKKDEITEENKTEGETEGDKPTDPPAPTEPQTEKPTEPPTEPPTDPAELSDPDMIGDFEIIPGARYYIWSPNSSLYLTVDGDFKWAGISQEDFTGKPDQMFVFEKLRVDEVSETSTRIVYKIRSLGTKAGYIDIEDGESSADGTAVIVMDEAQGDGSQEWFLKAQKKTKLMDTEDTKLMLDDFADVDLPIFSIMSMKAKSRCLDVNGVSVNPGGNIHLWSGGTANNQKWFFELVSDVESEKIIPRGKQELK